MKRACILLTALLVALLPACSSSGIDNYSGRPAIDDFQQCVYRNIHYALYVPDSYDGTEPYSLFITLPGYEGLYFQGEGENLRNEDFAFEAVKYNPRMIIAAPQLMDWHERSARETIELTEYLLSQFNINRRQVYLEGFSGGGETGSLVMCMRPDLYTAFLAVSTRWDGNLEVLASSCRPVYMAVGERDSYYGSGPMRNAYAELAGIYEREGLDESEIDNLVVLDIRPQSFFSEHGFSDQHAGGDAFAFDENVMGWLFSKEMEE